MPTSWPPQLLQEKPWGKAVRNRIFSIGHSTLPLESFIALLKQQHIDTVCDVRSQPYSRACPHFSREMMQHELAKHAIMYVFLGNELGARSSDPSLYVNGKVSYDRLAGSALFQRGLREIQDLALTSCVALMCAEGEPLACHRTILVSRYLQTNGYPVAHILGTGAVETHEDIMNRLLRILGLPESDMFKSRDEILAEAYSIQGKRIAYDPMKKANEGWNIESARAR